MITFYIQTGRARRGSMGMGFDIARNLRCHAIVRHCQVILRCNAMIIFSGNRFNCRCIYDVKSHCYNYVTIITFVVIHPPRKPLNLI